MVANKSPAASKRSRISVGIGSWTDKEYKGLLYPKGLPDNERLKTYASWFDHVELNSSYHRLPNRAFVANWVQQTPPDFLFDFKLPKEFSQSPEASGRNEALVAQLLGTARPLIEAGKLRTFFLVLPPSFTPEKNRLEELEHLIDKLRPHTFAIELRHRGWIEGGQQERTLDFFRLHRLVWIAVDMPRISGSTIMPPLDEVTNPKLAYLRLHGRRPDWLKLKDQEEKHTYEYSTDELKEIAARVRTLAEKADEVHVVANNHAQDFAPKTALALQKLLGIERKRSVPPIESGASDDLLPGF